MTQTAKTVTVGFGLHAERVPLTILFDGGPLVIAGVWNWEGKRLAEGLFRIYHKQFGFTLGPHYASIVLAEKGLKKALTLKIWDQKDPAWFRTQTWLHKWLDQQLGKYEDLEGGVWMKD